MNMNEMKEVRCLLLARQARELETIDEMIEIVERLEKWPPTMTRAAAGFGEKFEALARKPETIRKQMAPAVKAALEKPRLNGTGLMDALRAAVATFRAGQEFTTDEVKTILRKKAPHLEKELIQLSARMADLVKYNRLVKGEKVNGKARYKRVEPAEDQAAKRPPEKAMAPSDKEKSWEELKRTIAVPRDMEVF